MMKPFDCAFRLFETQAEMAKTLGVDESLISKWKHVFDGKVPMRYFATLLEEAKRRKVKLTTKDLVHGRQ